MPSTRPTHSRLQRTLSVLLALSLPPNSVGVVRATQLTPPTPERQCDDLAAHPADPQRVGGGVMVSKIDITNALPACKAASERPKAHARYSFQYGRALDAAKRFVEANQQYPASDSRRVRSRCS